MVYAPLLSFLAFLHIRHDVPLYACAALPVAVYALFFVPGYLVWRFAFRLTAATAMEAGIACTILGCFISPPMWYLSCVFGVGLLAPAIALVAAAVVPFLIIRSGCCPPRPAGHTAWRHATILWVAVLAAMVWGYEQDPVEIRGDEVRVMTPWGDHCAHAAIAGELARRVPPQSIPYISGVQSVGYHYMPNVWCEMLRRTCGVDAYECYFYIASPLRYVLVSLATYLALLRRFGTTGAALGVAALLGFVLYPEKYAYVNGFQQFLSSNYPAAFGVAGMFLAFYLATSSCRKTQYRALLLACLISALLLWFKANHAMIVAPTMALFSVWRCTRGRAYGWLAACLGVQIALLCSCLFEMSGAERNQSLQWAPFAFMEYWWAGNGLPAVADTWLRPVVDGLPTWMRLPAMVVLCVLHGFFVGVVLLLYAVIAMRLGRQGGEKQWSDRLMLLFLGVAVCGFLFLPVTQPWVWNLSMHNFVLVNAVLLALMGPVLVDAVRRWRSRGTLAAALTYSAVLAILVVNVSQLRTKAFWGKRTVCATLDRGLYECLRYVRRETPSDAVILQPPYDVRSGFAPAATMISQRRHVADFGDAIATRLQLGNRLRFAEAFYAAPTGDTDSRLRNDYGVDYVVAKAGGFPSDDGRAARTRVFAHGDYEVYRLDDRAGERESDTRLSVRPPPTRASKQPL